MKKFIKKFLLVILVFIIGLGVYYKIDNDNSKKFLHEIVLEQIGSEIKYKYLLKNPNKVSLNLTKKEKLEDFDELVKFLDENFLYMDYLEKEYDIKNFEKKLRKALKVSNSDLEFIYILNSFFAKTKNIAHLNGFFDSLTYEGYLELFSWYKENFSFRKFNYEVLNNEISAKNYPIIDKICGNLTSYHNKDEDSPINTPEDGPFNTPEEVIEYKFLNKDTAYLSVKSLAFDGGRAEKIIDRVYKNFYSKLGNYKNLIIDIRYNSGGNSKFGEDLLITPILKKNISYDVDFVYLSSKYNKDYLESFGFVKGIFEEKNKDYLKKFENLDKSILDRDIEVIKVTGEIYMNENLPKFNGKIYLLVDNHVYSSAERITYIYKLLNLGTIVGNNTLGDGLGIDPALKRLKNSGIIIRYSLLYGLNPDGSSNGIYGTKPDIDVGNKDALEVVMELIKKDA